MPGWHILITLGWGDLNNIENNIIYCYFRCHFVENEFVVNRDLDIEMDIRPRSHSGVLVFVASPREDFLILQMVNGNVRLQCLPHFVFINYQMSDIQKVALLFKQFFTTELLFSMILLGGVILHIA